MAGLKWIFGLETGPALPDVRHSRTYNCINARTEQFVSESRMGNMSHHRPNPFDSLLSRRQLLSKCGMGMGALALGTVLSQTGYGSSEISGVSPLGPHGPQFAGKAKRVIHLFMNGGPSQVDTFDPKP